MLTCTMNTRIISLCIFFVFSLKCCPTELKLNISPQTVFGKEKIKEIGDYSDKETRCLNTTKRFVKKLVAFAFVVEETKYKQKASGIEKYLGVNNSITCSKTLDSVRSPGASL